MAGLSKGAMSGLTSALASQSAPPNPKTPTDRTDPADRLLLDFQRIRRSLEVALTNIDDADPRMLIFEAMRACVVRLLASVETADAVDVLLTRMFPLASADLKAKLSAMFAPPPPSPTNGLGAGASSLGAPGGDQGPPGGATGSPPGPLGPPPGGAGEAGALPA
jgi:hypothetical protein